MKNPLRPPVSAPAEEDDLSDLSELDRILKRSFLDYTPQSQQAVLRKASELPGFSGEEEPEVKPAAPTRSAPERADEPEKTSGGSLGLRVIGILNNTYIIAEKPDGLILIDQHAAHERVLFERILKGVDGSLSQRLLIPVTLELSRSETMFVRRHADLLEKIGFEAEPFGTNTIKLNAIPAALSQDSSGTMFKDMLGRLVEGGAPGERVDYEQVAMCACKAAVKANDALTMEEALALLRQLSFCDLPFACPHGRPTILNISMKEIERRFGRR